MESRLHNVSNHAFLLPPDKYVVVWESENNLWESELDLRVGGPTDDWQLFDSEGKEWVNGAVSESRVRYRLNYRCATAALRGYRVFLYKRLRPIPGDEAVHYEYVQAEKTRFVYFPAGVTQIEGTVDLDGLPAGNYRMEIYFYEEEAVFSGGGTNFRLIDATAPQVSHGLQRDKILAVAPASLKRLANDSALTAAFWALAGESAQELFEAENFLFWQYGPPDSVGKAGEWRYFKYRTVFPKNGDEFLRPPRLATGL